MGRAYLQSLDPHSHKASSKNPGCFLSKPLCAWLACGFLSLALLHLLCCSPAGTHRAALSPLLQYINNTYSFVSTTVSVPYYLPPPARSPGRPPSVSSVQVEEERRSCNYAVGNWVWAPGHARRYNATECNAKESHDCIRNGRPDTGYLDWRWQPAGRCPLPAFDAAAFLSSVRGKHVAFVGDSMARNQAQSLVCLLSAAFPYRLLYRDAGGPGPRKHNFWRYAFPDHGVTVSFYWTPFLLRATGKAEDESVRDNHVHLDALGDRWAADADTIDVAVLAAAHWLLNGAIYYNGSRVVGAHGYPDLNVTGVGYAWPLRVAYRAAVDRLMSSAGRPRTVVLATFSPSHFEGKPTNDPTACAKTEPYKDGENDMEWMYREVRDVVYDEADAARARSGSGNGSAATATRIEVLDVSKLASMRPDGHPGLYMHDHPFANGASTEGLYSDCLHFCLPGPVDTFNEILLQMLRKRR